MKNVIIAKINKINAILWNIILTEKKKCGITTVVSNNNLLCDCIPQLILRMHCTTILINAYTIYAL